jgi:citrate lyase subunit beta/citryl-CoA lyase
MHVYRTFLFTPGNHARRVEKVFQSGADAAILDLEDAVATAEKKVTRRAVAEALQKPRSCLGYVRVNASGTEFCYGDLVEVMAAGAPKDAGGSRTGLDGVVLPKVESAAELLTIEWLLAQLEREHGIAPRSIDLIPIIETGVGLDRIDEIARAGSRVKRIAFGAGDFTLDMNLQWSREERELNYARAKIVLASRVAGLEPPIDTVWVRLADKDGLQASAQTSLRMGFQGRMCIHPDQIGIVHEVFTPTPEELARAEKIVAAFKQAEQQGSASIQLDGQFIDYPIVYKAQRIVATMQRIRAQTGA